MFTSRRSLTLDNRATARLGHFQNLRSRFSLSFVLAFGMVLVLPEVSRAEPSQPIAEQIAKTYGIDSFGQIAAIRFTWNRELSGSKISHKWEWSPKTDTVSYEGKDLEGNPVKVTYQRSQLDSQSEVVKKEIDPAFANDQGCPSA